MIRGKVNGYSLPSHYPTLINPFHPPGYIYLMQSQNPCACNEQRYASQHPLKVPRRLHLIKPRPRMLNHNPIPPCIAIPIPIAIMLHTPIRITIPTTHRPRPIPLTVLCPRRRHRLRHRHLILRFIRARVRGTPTIISVGGTVHVRNMAHFKV